MVRDRVWLIDRFSTSSGSTRRTRKFSRTRSNTTMVSLIEKPITDSRPASTVRSNSRPVSDSSPPQQHVVQRGEDRRHRELPLEAERDVDQEAHQHEQQRHTRRCARVPCRPAGRRTRCAAPCAGLPSLDTALRTPCAVRLCASALLTPLPPSSPLCGCSRTSRSLPLPKLCTWALTKPAAVQALAHLVDVGRLVEAQLDHGAAGEVQRVIEALAHRDRRWTRSAAAPCRSATCSAGA